MENATQAVDLISPSVDPTLPPESKPDTSHVFLVDTDSAVSRGIPPSPVKPHPSNEACEDPCQVRQVMAMKHTL